MQQNIEKLIKEWDNENSDQVKAIIFCSESKNPFMKRKSFFKSPISCVTNYFKSINVIQKKDEEEVDEMVKAEVKMTPEEQQRKEEYLDACAALRHRVAGDDSFLEILSIAFTWFNLGYLFLSLVQVIVVVLFTIPSNLSLKRELSFSIENLLTEMH